MHAVPSQCNATLSHDESCQCQHGTVLQCLRTVPKVREKIIAKVLASAHATTCASIAWVTGWLRGHHGVRPQDSTSVSIGAAERAARPIRIAPLVLKEYLLDEAVAIAVANCLHGCGGRCGAQPVELYVGGVYMAELWPLTQMPHLAVLQIPIPVPVVEDKSLGISLLGAELTSGKEGRFAAEEVKTLADIGVRSRRARMVQFLNMTRHGSR